MRNIGWLYYRDYFASHQSLNLEKLDYVQKNKTLFNQKLSDGKELTTLLEAMRTPLASHRLTLQTIYPGLLAGTGLPHEIKNDDVLRLGFSFDHSTGLPVIPGSSVKGRLRSFFSGRVYQKALELLAKKGTREEQEKARKQGQQLLRKAPLMEKYLLYVWQEELKLGELSLEDLLRLEWALFEGVSLDKVTMADDGIPDFKNLTENALPGPQLSLFFDAFPVKSENNKGQLLGEDTITPHRNRNRKLKEWDAVSNPVPLLFMKVLPNVHWEFGFRLPELEVREGVVIKSDQLQKLFMYLLTEHGAGAKTSVGYGQFEEVLTVEEEKLRKTVADKAKREAEQRAYEASKPKADDERQKYLGDSNDYLKTEDGWYYTQQLSKGTIIEARCVGKKPANPKIKRFRLLLVSPDSPKPEIELSYADDDILDMSCLLTIKTVFKTGKLKGKVESVEFKALLR